MNGSIRTDLASEARQVWQEGAKSGSLPGVAARQEKRQGLAVDVVEILSQEGEKELCKPKGKYVSISLDALTRREEDGFRRACQVVAEELRSQLKLAPGEGVLVAGLGNDEITPDAVGPLAAAQVLATRHLKEKMPEEFAAFRPVAVFRSGVLGATGVESAELTAAVAGVTAPARVIAVDALAARETERLCRTVQISDAGIVPGSGVGNARGALNRETLGVPVVAVGVPTVVDARTLCADRLSRAGVTAELPAEEGELFVTPRDIDSRVRDAARLIGYAINLALHDGMTIEDVDMFLG